MSFSDQINYIIQILSLSYSRLPSTSSSYSLSKATSIENSLVSSKFDYCNLLYTGISQTISTNFNAFETRWHVSLQTLQNIYTSHQHSKNYVDSWHRNSRDLSVPRAAPAGFRFIEDPRDQGRWWRRNSFPGLLHRQTSRHKFKNFGIRLRECAFQSPRRLLSSPSIDRARQTEMLPSWVSSHPSWKPSQLVILGDHQCSLGVSGWWGLHHIERHSGIFRSARGLTNILGRWSAGCRHQAFWLQHRELVRRFAYHLYTMITCRYTVPYACPASQVFTSRRVREQTRPGRIPQCSRLLAALSNRGLLQGPVSVGAFRFLQLKRHRDTWSVGSGRFTTSFRDTAHLYTPWFDAECRSIKRGARFPERRYRRTEEPLDRFAWIRTLRDKHAALKSKENKYWDNMVIYNSSHPKKLWRSVATILGELSKQTLSASDFLTFLEQMVETIQSNTAGSAPAVFMSTDCSFTSFTPCSQQFVRNLIGSAPSKSCELDLAPTFLIK